MGGMRRTRDYGVRSRGTRTYGGNRTNPRLRDRPGEIVWVRDSEEKSRRETQITYRSSNVNRGYGCYPRKGSSTYGKSGGNPRPYGPTGDPLTGGVGQSRDCGIRFGCVRVGDGTCRKNENEIRWITEIMTQQSFSSFQLT